jgi:hypothetical protein
MAQGGHFYQHLAEGITFIIVGGLWAWQGFKKAYGKNSRPSIFLGFGFIICGILALLGLV